MIQITTQPKGVTLEVTDWDDLEALEDIGCDDAAFLSAALDSARYLGNGWSVRNADSMDMMSESPCLLYNEETDDSGNYITCQKCYFWPSYAILSIYQTLLEEGEIFLERLW